MKLSYIVPVYKVEKYLITCVDSILSQTMDDYEIILVDDGSPDKCPEICDDYKEKYPNIIKVIHKGNGGLAFARNRGLEEAKGEYIFFIDSDDFLVGDKVKNLYEKAVCYDADVLQTSYFKLYEDSGLHVKMNTSFPTDKILFHADMEKELCHASSQSKIVFNWRNLYKRSFLLENRIRFDEKLKMIEDGPFNMQAFSLAKRFAAVDMPVYCYRIRDDSLQRKKYVEDYDKILQYQWRLKIKYFKENCTNSPVFYEDIAEYTIKAMLPVLLSNIYRNPVKKRYSILKRIRKSEMISKSFADYDINKFRSKSLDWLMTAFFKKRMFLSAHLLCRFVLYK